MAGNTRYPFWPELTDAEGDELSAHFDRICGDCVEGRCHWGGERSLASIAEAEAGREYVDPTYGDCGCSHHAASVEHRNDPTARARVHELCARPKPSENGA